MGKEGKSFGMSSGRAPRRSRPAGEAGGTSDTSWVEYRRGPSVEGAVTTSGEHHPIRDMVAAWGIRRRGGGGLAPITGGSTVPAHHGRTRDLIGFQHDDSLALQAAPNERLGGRVVPSRPTGRNLLSTVGPADTASRAWSRRGSSGEATTLFRDRNTVVVCAGRNRGSSTSVAT